VWRHSWSGNSRARMNAGLKRSGRCLPPVGHSPSAADPTRCPFPRLQPDGTALRPRQQSAGNYSLSRPHFACCCSCWSNRRASAR
jgi:hypothetical protein